MSALTERARAVDDTDTYMDTDYAEVHLRGSWLDNDEDDVYRRELATLLRLLRSYAIDNAEYFVSGAVSGSSSDRFYTSCRQLIDHLDGGVASAVEALLKAAPMFDYSRLQPGSGYRSMVTVVHKCCLHLLTLVRYIGVNRESYLFRAEHYSRELEAYVTVLGQLRACLYYLQKLVLYCMDGSLFPDENALSPDEYHTAEYLMKEVESLCQEAFYGRCLGFQFCPSMVRPLKTINLVMASYSDVYCRSSRLHQLATSVLSGHKYFMNPELRAKQVVKMTRSNDIQFCKGFWGLAENSFIHRMPRYICQSVAVDKVIMIGPEPFSLLLADSDSEVQIMPPSAHTGVAPVNTRLISARCRSGQETWMQQRQGLLVHEVSRCLIIHYHGGGFVAQSSASHQVYLRNWANDLDVPILCVDYSLAPENRFPRQLEEVYYAYCWALKNCHLLGWTGERVLIVGDSAGANLAVAVTMKVASEGIRKPDAILSVYGCLLIHYIPSPSRILALMDPLLPLGVLSLCLHAYAAGSECNSNEDADNAVASDCGSSTARTETGRNKLQCMSDMDVDSTGDITVVCPSGEVLDTAVPKSATDASVSNRCSSMFKSSSMPLMCSQPPAVTLTNRTSLDSELRYLSTFAKLRQFTSSPLENSKNGQIARSPYMSPLLASDEMLRQLCPVHLIACHLDPMLDDSVTFARRLRHIHRPVQLEFLADLPHGFLNFVLVSQEAKAASDRCVAVLRSLLPVD